MKIILGKRDYEKTATGKYPKYDLGQLNLYVSMDCPSYSGIQVVCNIKSFDLFGKYQNELTKKEKLVLDEKIKEEYGFHNANIDDLIDWKRFEYDKESKRFNKKNYLTP